LTQREGEVEGELAWQSEWQPGWGEAISGSHLLDRRQVNDWLSEAKPDSSTGYSWDACVRSAL
jgi:hypothetical protein